MALRSGYTKPTRMGDWSSRPSLSEQRDARHARWEEQGRIDAQERDAGHARHWAEVRASKQAKLDNEAQALAIEQARKEFEARNPTRRSSIGIGIHPEGAQGLADNSMRSMDPRTPGNSVSRMPATMEYFTPGMDNDFVYRGPDAQAAEAAAAEDFTRRDTIRRKQYPTEAEALEDARAAELKAREDATRAATERDSFEWNRKQQATLEGEQRAFERDKELAEFKASLRTAAGDGGASGPEAPGKLITGDASDIRRAIGEIDAMIAEESNYTASNPKAQAQIDEKVAELQTRRNALNARAMLVGTLQINAGAIDLALRQMYPQYDPDQVLSSIPAEQLAPALQGYFAERQPQQAPAQQGRPAGGVGSGQAGRGAQQPAMTREQFVAQFTKSFIAKKGVPPTPEQVAAALQKIGAQ